MQHTKITLEGIRSDIVAMNNQILNDIQSGLDKVCEQCTKSFGDMTKVFVCTPPCSSNAIPFVVIASI